MKKSKELLEKWWLFISIVTGICTILGGFTFAIKKINTFDSDLYYLSQKTTTAQENIKQLRSYSDQVRLNTAEENFLKTKVGALEAKVQSNTDRINRISNAYVTLSYFDRDMDIIKSDLTHQMNLIIDNIKMINRIKGHDHVN